MYLFIDAGNTRIKYAGHDGADWLFHDAVPSDASAPLKLPAGFAPQRILVVSVADAICNAFIEAQLASWAECIEWFRSTPERCGLRNGYEEPTQLGADRWAGAIAAWQHVKGACLVVAAGTATTIDVITADGVFAGGCIAPGLEMMRRALARGTAALPLAAGHFEALPRNTADAIFSGCLNAQLGSIARMRGRLPDDAPVLLTGGAAPALRDGIDGNVVELPRLVLEGLLWTARSEQGA
ncbi:type III pantothenate kinase [Uliginosibacterium sp. H3]|uniref:Type III pantothenate kinase n=1 Tax=Uliginosibacterium silvisoli TaxID=3114758 RepID=A0ABU6JY96_9RHOO|nr:type III pantothenate kinase [Uliginosibacterium sp. H3]